VTGADRPDETTFERTLRRALDPQREPDAGLIGGLSGATAADAKMLLVIWATSEPERRRWLASQLLASTEADFRVDFKALFLALLTDPDPEVRATAIEGLWEATDLALMERFATILQSDEDDRVRARAAMALGSFIERGQLGRIDPRLVQGPLDTLLEAACDEGEEVTVRRRAIESAGYAEDEAVAAAIEDAMVSSERALRAGAVRAMGNSADDVWSDSVLSELRGTDPEIVFEAARAAGELLLSEAVPDLIELADGLDREIQMEAIWALGEIGGTRARRALERLMSSGPDEDLEEALEDALASASLSDGDLWWNG
jgi:HEAT repeat protein